MGLPVLCLYVISSVRLPTLIVFFLLIYLLTLNSIIISNKKKMTATMRILVCVCVVLISMAESAPQGGGQPDEKPMPYEYKYDVKDPEKELFFGANEVGDESGKVTGGYRVLLPDGRLMTVEYSVEGDSGFVPKISFEENAKPF